MAGMGKCDYKDCPMSSSCTRFLTKVGELLDFKYICNEDNNFQWYCKENVEIVKKEGE